MVFPIRLKLSSLLFCLTFTIAATAQSPNIDFDGPVTPGPTLNVTGAVGDQVVVYAVPIAFTDCSSIPPIPAAGSQLQVIVAGAASPNVILTSQKQSITLSVALTAGQRLCLKSTNSSYNYSSPKPADVKAASPVLSIVGSPAPGTTGVTVLATATADISVYSFPSSYKLANGATLCAVTDLANPATRKLPIGPRGADSFTVAADAQNTFQLTNPIAAATQLCLEAKPVGANPFFSSLVPIKATPQTIAFNGIVSPGTSFSVTGQTGATVSLYSTDPGVTCNKDVPSHGALLKFSPSADNFELVSATSDLTLSSPLSDGEHLCLTARDAGTAPGADPTEFAVANVVGSVRFAETPVAGKMSFSVEGDPGYPLSAYQFPAGFKPKSGASCGPDDIAGNNGQVTLIHFASGSAVPGPVTIPLPAPAPPGVTSLIALDSPLVAGTALCLVESANGIVYSSPQTVAAPPGITTEPRFAHTFYTVGAVISNELGASNSTGAAQYVDLGFAFQWWKEGITKTRHYHYPGLNTSFSGRFSSVPVAAQTPASTATTLNILSSQESARVLQTTSLPFRVGSPSVDGDSLFAGPVAKASITTLINPSQTLTTQSGSAAVPVQYSPTYNDWSVGGQIGWRRYYDSNKNAAAQTMWQLDGTIGKFSNLQDLACTTTQINTKLTPTSAPANTSCYNPTTFVTFKEGRISIPRIELAGFARIPSTIFVIGIDANLSQFQFWVPPGRGKTITGLDVMNRAGNDVRIYFGISGSISDLFKKLSLPTAP
jgi:hypothetical protein